MGGRNDSREKPLKTDGHTHPFHTAAACSSHSAVCVSTCTRVDSLVVSCTLAYTAASHPHTPMNRSLPFPRPIHSPENTAVFCVPFPCQPWQPSFEESLKAPACVLSCSEDAHTTRLRKLETSGSPLCDSGLSLSCSPSSYTFPPTDSQTVQPDRVL